MQDSLNQPLLRGKTKSYRDHLANVSGCDHEEFILFGDNLLECLSLLNPAVSQADLWDFQYVVYEPVDRPIYVFASSEGSLISIAACGNYMNWPLPQKVSELIFRYDLPDFVLFSISSQAVIFAGELTETASVGNSQWQRELRKIAAAELGIPFVYQTGYSGMDDGLNQLREPTSLIVYNAFIYTIRYKVPSLVFFVEPNITTSKSRIRKSNLDSSEISRLLVAYILADITKSRDLVDQTQAKIFGSMADYLKEEKLSTRSKGKSRLVIDFPCVNVEVSSALMENSSSFVDELLSFLKSPSSNSSFTSSFDFSKFNTADMTTWTDKRSTNLISELFEFHDSKGLPMPVAPLAKFAAGIVSSTTISKFFKQPKFKGGDIAVERISKFEECVVIPVLFHKNSNGTLQFTKDPYAGNTAAFAELLGFDINGNQIRGLITYCVSDNPANFNLHAKKETNIYRSVAKYSDVLVMDTGELITEFVDPEKVHNVTQLKSIDDLRAQNMTEDMAVVSTYLKMGAINSDWEVCMIAIHHSSWQQIRVRNKKGSLATEKVGRNSSKIDLIMQNSDKFFAVEGKRNVTDFFSSKKEQSKIQVAFNNARASLDNLFGSKSNTKIVAFVCLLNVPLKNSDSALENEIRRITQSISNGEFDQMAGQDFVLVGVYLRGGSTQFQLFFSKGFNQAEKDQLKLVFEN